MEIRITHQGAVLADLEITPDGQIQVRSLQPGSPQGQMGAAQYVWGGSGGGGQQQAGAPQYVWGAQPGAPQYVWGSQPGAPQYVWGGGAPGGAAQYVWGATNTRPHGTANNTISVDCPGTQSPKGQEVTSGIKVTDGLLDK